MANRSPLGSGEKELGMVLRDDERVILTHLHPNLKTRDGLVETTSMPSRSTALTAAAPRTTALKRVLKIILDDLEEPAKDPKG